MIERKSLIVYLLIAFTLAWVLFVLPLAFGAPGTSRRQMATLITWSAAMWAPGVAAVVATRRVDRQPLSALNLGKLGERRIYVWAWLIPPLLVAGAGIFSALLGVGQLDLEFTQLRQAMAGTAGADTPPWFVIAVQLLIAMTIGPLFNTLFALGEELGWRGYLLPKLLPLGQGRAILISGVIWGVWHWPAILQGHNYPNHPYLGMLLMIGFCVLFGAFLSWLYLRAGSPWAPALGHAMLNAVAGFPLLFMPKVDMALGGTLTSLTGWIPMLLFIGWLIWRKQLPVPEQIPPLEEAAL
jgi:membrane protease YdiL (CAAX protease family)